MRKLDVFNHFFPAQYYRKMVEIAPGHKDMGKRTRSVPLLHDLEGRFRVMDEFGEDYQQILSLPSPPIEAMAGPRDAVLLARIANDGLADLVSAIPIVFQVSWRRCP